MECGFTLKRVRDMIRTYSQSVIISMIYIWNVCFGWVSMLCYVMWNLFTVGILQFCSDSTIASLEANRNRSSNSFITTWKVSVFGVILLLISLYSVRMRENTDQDNSEYEHFSRSAFELGFQVSWVVSIKNIYK